MTILVTGSGGRIGCVLLAGLTQHGWPVVGFDRIPADGGLVGDITSPDDLDRAMIGVEAVVHFAGQPTEAPWPVIREANIEGTFQVFEAARRAGVRRIVYASSNHAVGFTPVTENLRADITPRPDTLYGVSKVFGEALGRYYADRYRMQVACLRIGTFEDEPPDDRSLSTWLSPGDCVRLVDACLRSVDLTYALVWAISANQRRTWSLEPALALGYEPRDDAQRWADDIPAGAAYPSDALVGGGFTSEGFGIDEVAERQGRDDRPEEVR